MTLVEILVVVAIIGILIAAIGLIGAGVKEHGNKDLTLRTMDSLMSAIQEFHDSPKNFRHHEGWPVPPNDPVETRFPDPDEEPQDAYHNLWRRKYDTELYYFGPPANPPSQPAPPPPAVLESNATNPNDPEDQILSSEGLYVFLSFVSSGKSLVDKLPQGAKRNRHAERGERHWARPVGVTSNPVDLTAIVDAWKTPMRYRLYVYRNNGRPFLWSAGPDGKFAADPNNAAADPNGKDDVFSDKRE